MFNLPTTRDLDDHSAEALAASLRGSGQHNARALRLAKERASMADNPSPAVVAGWLRTESAILAARGESYLLCFTVDCLADLIERRDELTPDPEV